MHTCLALGIQDKETIDWSVLMVSAVCNAPLALYWYINKAFHGRSGLQSRWNNQWTGFTWWLYSAYSRHLCGFAHTIYSSIQEPFVSGTGEVRRGGTRRGCEESGSNGQGNGKGVSIQPSNFLFRHSSMILIPSTPRNKIGQPLTIESIYCVPWILLLPHCPQSLRQPLALTPLICILVRRRLISPSSGAYCYSE